MTIIQLEYLLAVANCGSFSAASEKCFVTQPSLSMQIKNLEEELGVVLLDRSKKPVVPTEAGIAVIAQTKLALASFYQIKEEVDQLKGEVSGVLRLGVIPTIAPYLLHRFIPSFAAKYPDVELQIKEMVTSEIINALNKDVIDVAILAGGTPEEISEDTLFQDKFYAYVSEKHPMINRDNINIGEIDLNKLLLLSEGHCLRDQVLELCTAKAKIRHSSSDIINRFMFESGSLETLMRIVDSTDSLTVIPFMCLDFITENRKHCVKRLSEGTSSRPITMAVRRTYVKKNIINALRNSIIESWNEFIKNSTVKR